MGDRLVDSLQPSQIVCLEHGGQRLYVEVIQILRDRQSGWLRPLCFCTPAHLCTEEDEAGIPLQALDGSYFLLDMRQESDLIWPLSQCRIVLDTEAIPILAILRPESYTRTGTHHTRSTLKTFIHKIWNDSPLKSMS
ncbi:MAG: hypothetical protein AB4042_18610 [Leptolyngbyaceae cyanobacterium]